MREQNYALFGLVAPLIAIFFIAISILLSPWFSWWNNALSDLGHSVNSEVAPLFNFGLLLSGFFLIFYSITSFRNHAKYTSYLLAIVGLTLQLVATFDEVYGSLHSQVSVLFFVALYFASVSYVIEKRSVLAFAALIIGLVSWILYGIDIYRSGIAVPEIISLMVTSIWVMLSALRIYVSKSTTKTV
ncbi:DUF998 domain-containing protein [Candidatus Bathyarchaeota archaeon]|nr:DUF998 domain-containing protein [Candidatus Bathyarchaeota archaeon]